MTSYPTIPRLLRVVFCVAPIAVAALVLIPVAAAQEKSSGSGAKKTSTSAKASPTPKKKSASTTPKPKAKPTPKKASGKSTAKATPKSTPKASPKATPKPEEEPKAEEPSNAAETSPPPKELPLPKPDGAEEAPAKKAENGGKPLPGVLSVDDLANFDAQPERVRKMITAALELSKRGLTYTYGSADPEKGGMDCSGAIHYLLREQGFTDVPRDASGQYVWARKNGEFFAVISKKEDSFEFADLKPGDLLFWNGTYNVNRDPPVTHTMIYLGLHKERNEPVMWGASDGRTYDGKARWGVGVFDFKMPRTAENGGTASKADFLGYARIPEKAQGSTD